MNTLEDIASKIDKCRECRLCETRLNAVPGSGNPKAKILIIGEAPGRNEDEGGEPFIGAAGKRLDGLLAAAGLTREDVFIANVLKCRPPKNRDPKKDEVKACADFLNAQIEAISPEVIVPLGNFAARFVLDTERGISEIHGQLFIIDNEEGTGERKVVPMYHPAAGMYSPGLRPQMEEDFKHLGEILSDC